MIRTFVLSDTPLAPIDPAAKMPGGLTDPFDPDGRVAVTSWLRHVAAGRIGNTPPMSGEARAAVLANARLICGAGRLPPE